MVPGNKKAIRMRADPLSERKGRVKIGLVPGDNVPGDRNQIRPVGADKAAEIFIPFSKKAVMQIGDHVYTEKKEAGQAIIEACKAMKSPEPVPLGSYRGLSMELSYSSVSQEFVIALHGKGT